MRIRKDNTIAVGIDFQERLVPAMYNKEELIANTVRLLSGLKVLGTPIYLTQQYTKGLGMTVPEIREAVGTDEYLDKIRFSGYSELKKVIPGPEVCPNVIICGMETHICVLQTAMELAENGYKPILVTDCVSSRAPRNTETAITRAIQEGFTLTTYEAILFELLEVAGNEETKRIQKIIK